MRGEKRRQRGDERREEDGQDRRRQRGDERREEDRGVMRGQKKTEG